jgi:site-specific DNA-methyltransferase (adenine-specific)
MTPHFFTDRVRLFHGDCREVLRQLPDASVDAVVTDPPYELGFMGKAWDGSGVAYGVDLWREVLRVLKPGGHLLAFGGTRTYHRMACAIEHAGFEIRDSIHWLYGSGFPKSLDVSKAIDKAAGAEREVKPWIERQRVSVFAKDGADKTATSGNLECPLCGRWKFAPDYCKCPRDDGAATPEAAKWEGWGTALKPAHEPVVVARKPLVGTVAANVLEHGTGALNVDGCRVGTEPAFTDRLGRKSSGGLLNVTESVRRSSGGDGRWPVNVVLDPEAAEVLDQQSGDDEAGVSRFFTVAGFTDDDLTSFRYVAKPDRAERNAGLDGNFHPTVKPLDLMRWLVRLVTPPGGTVLDPFAGSGTTLAAAVLEDRQAVGIELTAEYLPLIKGRVRWAQRESRFGPVTGPTKVRKDVGAPTLFDEDGAA